MEKTNDKDVFSEDNKIAQANEIDLDNLFEETGEDISDENITLDCDCFDEPSCSFEELHSSNFDRYLVPLFISQFDEGSFLGNGVIVDSYLVTAAHLAICEICKQPISRLFFRLDKEYYEISDRMVIHDGRGMNGSLVSSKDGVHDDLIIYELNKKYDSFELNLETVYPGLELGMNSYRRDDVHRNNILQCDSVSIVTCLYGGYEQHPSNNCYKVINPNVWFYRGNSGSALFRLNKVYGILIQASQNGYGKIGTVLGAGYINKVIREHESK